MISETTRPQASHQNILTWVVLVDLVKDDRELMTVGVDVRKDWRMPECDA